MEKAGEKIERNTLGLEEQGVVHRSFQHEPYFSIEHEFSKTAFIEAREVVGVLLFFAVSEKHMGRSYCCATRRLPSVLKLEFLPGFKFFYNSASFFHMSQYCYIIIAKFPLLPKGLDIINANLMRKT